VERGVQPDGKRIVTAGSVQNLSHRFRSFHLAFWLLLSFAREALVYLNAIGRSAVSERPDLPLSSTTGRDLSQWACYGEDAWIMTN
jgi:hypothetical protein